MNGISSLVSSLVNAVWQVAAVALAGWAATRALKKLGPRAEHIGWISTLVIAILSPAFPLLRSLPALLLRRPAPGGHLSIAFAAAPEAAREFNGVYQWPALVLWLLAVFYSATLLYFAGRMAWSLSRVRAVARNAEPLLLTGEQQQIWSRCRHSFHLPGARILSSVAISGPVVAGIRRPILIMPAGFTDRCTGSDFLAALAHECAHANRRDFQKNLCYEVISLVLAFHPAIWLIKARIAQTREMICDSMVAEQVLDARAYAHSLLRLASLIALPPRTASVHAIGIFDANILEKRIMIIRSQKQVAGRFMRYSLTILAAMLLAFSGIIAAAKAMTIEPQSAPAADQSKKSADNSAPYGPIYKVGKDVSAPILIHSTEAKFPKSGKSLKANFSAIVVVGLIVDRAGMPQNVHITRSYNRDFDAEAIKAIEQYRFKPAQHAGQPVAVAINIEVNFKKY
jgi:bla regulator protein blaR1